MRCTNSISIKHVFRNLVKKDVVKQLFRVGNIGVYVYLKIYMIYILKIKMIKSTEKEHGYYDN